MHVGVYMYMYMYAQHEGVKMIRRVQQCPHVGITSLMDTLPSFLTPPTDTPPLLLQVSTQHWWPCWRRRPTFSTTPSGLTPRSGHTPLPCQATPHPYQTTPHPCQATPPSLSFCTYHLLMRSCTVVKTIKCTDHIMLACMEQPPF